jgi:DNA repair protein RecN (Recombination protein N)
MLTSLSVRHVVLIEALDLSLRSGLCGLTGETGAGKSILLDALGLAMGQRSQARLVQQGASQAIVTATFELSAFHPVHEILKEHGLESDDQLILRRILTAEGKSKAFINDQPVSIGLLAKIGLDLVEIHGQFDRLLETSSHRNFLDNYAKLHKQRKDVAEAYVLWKKAHKALETARHSAQQNKDNEENLRKSIEDLQNLSPKGGEEDLLIQERETLVHGVRITELAEKAQECLSGSGGAESTIIQAFRALENIPEGCKELFSSVIQAVDRASVEVTEAARELKHLMADIDLEPARLDEVEERLTLLRKLALKHQCTPDELSHVYERLVNEIAILERGEDALYDLEKAVEQAKQVYEIAARELSKKRHLFAEELDTRVRAELPPLKMEHAQFKTAIHFTENESSWSEHGMDNIEFQISTNPGQPFGRLSEIASGGERSRFMLALKVVLAQAGSIPTLVFDEIDAGVGGAVARAVGERLKRLASDVQVLVVTHSPQVASVSNQHLHVSKGVKDGVTYTHVAELNTQEQREEIARMLAGDTITDEARAAADQLLLVKAG